MMNVMHVGTYGIMMDGGRMLLMRKSRGPYKGMLDLPGGKLEHGEVVEEALAREILEETGVVATKFAFVGNETRVVEFNDKAGDVSMYHVGLLYKVTECDVAASVSDMKDEDSLGAQWYSLEELAHELVSPFAAWAIERAMNNTL